MGAPSAEDTKLSSKQNFFVFVVLALVLDFTAPWEVPFTSSVHSGTKYTPLDNRAEVSFDALAWPLTGFLTTTINRKLRLVPQSFYGR